MGQLLVAAHIAGRPRSKGSMKVITPRGRKPIMVEDHQHSKPWRKQMAKHLAALKVNPEPYVGAVEVRAVFMFEQTGPSAALLPWPTLNAGINANGDVDKLTRNLFDALQDAEVIADDCQVARQDVWKRWVTEVDLGPGVWVEVKAL